MEADAIISRLKLLVNAKNDAALARHLKKAPTVIYTWRTRNTIDCKFIIESFPDVDLNYIFKGSSKKDVYNTNKIDDLDKTDEIIKLKIENSLLKELLMEIKTKND